MASPSNSGGVGDGEPPSILTSSRSSVRNPLSVICFFFGLVEVGLAYSSGVSSGWVQIGVLIFMGVFAVGIAATFFTFLWRRNWVFYPPSEFSDPSVEAFVNAMRHERATVDGATISRIAVESVSQVFSDNALLEKLDLVPASNEQSRPMVEKVVREIQKNVVARVQASVLHIDARPLKGTIGPEWEEPYDAEMPVNRFLDRVWFRLQPFPPYPYGTVWGLRNAASGQSYDDLGFAWATGQSAGTSDSRTLREVGIAGGMTLEVFSIRT